MIIIAKDRVWVRLLTPTTNTNVAVIIDIDDTHNFAIIASASFIMFRIIILYLRLHSLGNHNSFWLLSGFEWFKP